MLEVRNSALPSSYYPSCVYGIDFSGSKKAGNKIWIASATISGDVLKIRDCRQAKDLRYSAIGRDQCLNALRHFISTRKACAFGLDFPFGLPHVLAGANSWEEFILSFDKHYHSPDCFKDACLKAAHGRELKRVTDREAKTPFSPYNLRLYRQTYFGICDVLAPLVRDQLAYVLPMQSALPGRPWVFEVCPASTLKQIKAHSLRYKGSTEECRVRRARILKKIEAAGAVLIETSPLRSKILDDPYGDALDCVIAAFATFHALRNLARSSFFRTAPYVLEGYVYI